MSRPELWGTTGNHGGMRRSRGPAVDRFVNGQGTRSTPVLLLQGHELGDVANFLHVEALQSSRNYDRAQTRVKTSCGI